MLITTRGVGKRKVPVEEWEYQPPADITEPGDGGLTLRELLSRIVREEVRLFHLRQRDKTLVHVLSNAQISQAAQTGKVSMGLQEFTQKVDSEEAVATALLAFTDGLYLVFIDDEEQRDLDAQVFVHQDSRLVFVQLTFLAGA
jgi:hypothetical protein